MVSATTTIDRRGGLANVQGVNEVIMSTSEETLDRLIKLCVDAEGEYRAAAAHASLGNLKQFLLEQSKLRQRFVKDLQEEVRLMGGDPPTSGTLSGTADRLAMDVKVDFAGDVVLVKLVGEDAEELEKEYEEALAHADLSERCRKTLQHQLGAICSTVMQLDKLRSAYEQGR